MPFVDQIAAGASATKGAFYHHFSDKLTIFREVTELIERELAQSIRDSILRHDDPVTRLQEGCKLFLAGCADPLRAQTALIDAPAVLGWRARREIDSRYGLGVLESVLRDGMKAGLLEKQAVRPLAHLILGAALEGGMLIANAPPNSRTRAAVIKPLLRMLKGARCQWG